MSYEKLKKAELLDLCEERGIETNKDLTNKDLVALLVKYDSNQNATQDGVSDDTEVPKAPVEPKLKNAEKIAGEVTTGVTMDNDFYKKHFSKSPKKRVIIPLGQGEKAVHKDSNGNVQYAVEVISINGYAITIRKGVYVEVPEEFAEVIERYTGFQSQSDKEMTTEVLDALA